MTEAPVGTQVEMGTDPVPPAWALGPFSRPVRILEDRPEVTFNCPVAGARVDWAAKDLFNPGAVVHDGKVSLLVRAEDHVGRYAGISRIGLATSADGVNFDLEPEPVLAPGDDRWQAWEWPGGCEDPRVVEAPDGGFVCAYTAFDGKVASLFVATSSDLRQWTKHGPAFAGTGYVRIPSKSGAIVTELKDGRLVAARVDGKFWMYWGEGTIYAATSDDLVRWTPVEIETAPDRYLTFQPTKSAGSWKIERVPGALGLRPIAGPRRHRFDSLLTEPGPPALLTPAGVVLIYNAPTTSRAETQGRRLWPTSRARCCSTGPTQPRLSLARPRRSCGSTRPSPTARSATSASPRASSPSRAPGVSTSASPTRGSGSAPPRCRVSAFVG